MDLLAIAVGVQLVTIVRRTMMNAHPILVPMAVRVVIYSTGIIACVLLDLLEYDVKPILMNVFRFHVKMAAPAWTKSMDLHVNVVIIQVPHAINSTIV
jgi:hypothetical protein